MCSKHSIKRVAKRTGCSKKTAPKRIENAYAYGLTSDHFPDRERDYMDYRSSIGNGVICLYYNAGLYIFSESGVCITVLKPPKWFGKTKIYHSKELIRNPHKQYSYKLMKEDTNYGLSQVC